MKGNFKSIIFIALLAFHQGSVLAATFNYSQITLGYSNQSTKIDEFNKDLDANGYYLAATFDIARNYGIQVGLNKSTGDTAINGINVELDADTKMLGFFFHAPIAQKTDVVLAVAILQGEFKTTQMGSASSSEDRDGQLLSVAIRMLATKNLELNAGINQSFVDNESDSEIMFGISGYINKNISAGINYLTDNDNEMTRVFITKYF